MDPKVMDPKKEVFEIVKNYPRSHAQEWALKRWKDYYIQYGRHKATERCIQDYENLIKRASNWVTLILAVLLYFAAVWKFYIFSQTFLILLGLLASALVWPLWHVVRFILKIIFDQLGGRTYLNTVRHLEKSPKLSGEIKSIQLIEDVLATEREGEPFKIGWLNANDIKFTVRRKEVDELKKLFKKHNAILMEGPSASGKTVIAKQFGLEMAKKGYFVYYANLTVQQGLRKGVIPEELPYKLEDELKGLDADIYLIIEDVHNYIEPYDKMNWVVDDKHIKLLLVSRPLKKFEFTEWRQLEGRKAGRFDWAHKFEITSEAAIPKIIRQAVKSVKNEGIKFDENKLDKVKKFVKGNLYILVFAILAAKEKDKPLHEVTDEDIEKQVDKYIRGDRMLQFKSLHEKVAEAFGIENRELPACDEEKLDAILKFISLTSQFELPLGEELIARLVKVERDDVRRFMRPLRDSGDIVELRERNRRSYIIPHARLAQLMSNALVESEDEMLDFYLTYICKGDYPGTLTMRMKWFFPKRFKNLKEKLPQIFPELEFTNWNATETAYFIDSLDFKLKELFFRVCGNRLFDEFIKQDKVYPFLIILSSLDRRLFKYLLFVHKEMIEKTISVQKLYKTVLYLKELGSLMDDEGLLIRCLLTCQIGFSKAINNADWAEICQLLKELPPSYFSFSILETYKDEIASKSFSNKSWSEVFLRMQQLARDNYELAIEFERLFNQKIAHILSKATKNELLETLGKVHEEDEVLKEEADRDKDMKEALNMENFTRRLICHYKDIIIEKFGSVEAMPKELAEVVRNCPQKFPSSPAASC